VKNIFSNLKNRFSGPPPNTDEPVVVLTVKSGLTTEFIQKYALSDRQADVTQALLLGKHDREIAVLLNIKLNTVKTHLKHIYKKTGTRGRYALMSLVGIGGNK
jgi:DNA-binding CsgD family transcriptional regulator